MAPAEISVPTIHKTMMTQYLELNDSVMTDHNPNKRIIDGLKKRLEEKNGLWVDKLDGVLWSHRTMPRKSTNKTPFSLSHSMEAMALAEISVPTIHKTMMTQTSELNDSLMTDHVDQLEDERNQALLRIQNYQL
ncbi:hypothetical protein V5N11_032723 [Cardamine amara subsp. amara]|uniref:Uncharacterized protein n=1 Tax=Cardamine amara subsp. amara TaxID=228776 RepID=A0ABD1BVP2_CARAN